MVRERSKRSKSSYFDLRALGGGRRAAGSGSVGGPGESEPWLRRYTAYVLARLATRAPGVFERERCAMTDVRRVHTLVERAIGVPNAPCSDVVAPCLELVATDLRACWRALEALKGSSGDALSDADVRWHDKTAPLVRAWSDSTARALRNYAEAGL